MKNFNFNDLFVLDLANNHQGSVEHGKSIIKYCSELSKKNNLRSAIKFQYRNLPEFVHKSHHTDSTNKHVPRFLSTMLSWDEFEELKNYANDLGLLTICTPFDENSVEIIEKQGFDIIKVASCSATDWPLLEAISQANLPVIASTGGLNLATVDRLVSFLRHSAVDFALMHCVSIYPTPDENCNLLDIKEFVERYPEVTVGWSTHENPEDIIHVGLALALGATMFERHVGLPTSEIKLNAYSSNPKQLEDWIDAHRRAQQILGTQGRVNITQEERTALDGLRRGVFLREDILEGENVTADNVYFAFPLAEGGLSSGDFGEGLVADQNYAKDSPLVNISPEYNDVDLAQSVLKSAIHEVKAMLAKAKIHLGHDFRTEYSHHSGIKNFRKVGTVLIEVVNREYAKKILVQLPGQSHPLHMHKLKEETFIVLQGSIELIMDGKSYTLLPGEKITVLPGIWHEFSSVDGCILEEISTTAISGDSVYKDKLIDKMSSLERKTKVDHWGRFQIREQLLDQ
jgi:sialic acid synthase SpsE/quercetin dioxygenase-like cupin family protein